VCATSSWKRKKIPPEEKTVVKRKNPGSSSPVNSQESIPEDREKRGQTEGYGIEQKSQMQGSH
jgi:hypothetical protein